MNRARMTNVKIQKNLITKARNNENTKRQISFNGSIGLIGFIGSIVSKNPN